MFRFLTDENEINITNGVDFTDAIIEWYDRQNFTKPIVFSHHTDGGNTVVLICDGEELKEPALAAACDTDTYNKYGLGERKYKVHRGIHNQNIIGEYLKKGKIRLF